MTTATTEKKRASVRPPTHAPGPCSRCGTPLVASRLPAGSAYCDNRRCPDWGNA